MSTKTTFKRVALVAVASLGFGVLSVAPSQAADPNVDVAFAAIVDNNVAPSVASAVRISATAALTADGSVTAAQTGILTATITTKPAGSALGTDSVTASINLATIDTAATGVTLDTATVNSVRLASKTGSTGAAAETATVFSFIPDAPGYYVVTLTPTGTMASETLDGGASGAAATYGFTVKGASIVQGTAASIGKSTGSQINGRQSAVAFYLPKGSSSSSRYEISATGAGIVGIFTMTSKSNAADATTFTATTGVTKKNGTDFTSGATFAGQATVTNAAVAGSAVTDGFVVTTTSAVDATVVISVKSVDPSTGELTALSSATITYGAAPVVALAASAYTQLATGTNTATAAVGAVDSVVAGSKVPASPVARIGSIAVKLLNASGVEVTESYTATITGAGTLGHSIAGATTVIGRSITVKQGADVYIFADGTGGVGTITITTAAGLVVATKTVSFYGDASVIVLSSNSNAVVGTLAAPVKATAYDAAGYVVKGAVVYATSSDTTIISNSYAGPYTTDSKGEVSIPLTGVKLGSAKITVGLASSATDITTTGYAVKSDALTVTVGSSKTEQAGVVVTTDKQVYTPGSYAYVTVKAVDKDGKTLSPLASTTDVYTVFAAGGISGSLPFETVTGIISSTGFVPATKAGTATAADPIVAQAGEFVYKIKLPTYAGDFTFSWTTAAASNFPGNTAAGAVAGSTTVTLSDPGSQAAVDAAAEATDAANAATDAALAAADAADAATAAAEDASASVAKLSKSVTTALNNLKKQITSLTALVNKLLKR